NLFRPTKFDGTESETLQIGTGFGITPDIEQGPDGNLYVVSNTDQAIYMISRRVPVPPEKGGPPDKGVGLRLPPGRLSPAAPPVSFELLPAATAFGGTAPQTGFAATSAAGPASGVRPVRGTVDLFALAPGRLRPRAVPPRARH